MSCGTIATEVSLKSLILLVWYESVHAGVTVRFATYKGSCHLLDTHWNACVRRCCI